MAKMQLKYLWALPVWAHQLFAEYVRVHAFGVENVKNLVAIPKVVLFAGRQKIAILCEIQYSLGAHVLTPDGELGEYIEYCDYYQEVILIDKDGFETLVQDDPFLKVDNIHLSESGKSVVVHYEKPNWDGPIVWDEIFNL